MQQPPLSKSPKSLKYLHLAFVLALLAVVGTLALCWLVFLRWHFVNSQVVAPLLRWLVVRELLSVAILDRLFYPALYALLASNTACSLGAVVLAWPALSRMCGLARHP